METQLKEQLANSLIEIEKTNHEISPSSGFQMTNHQVERTVCAIEKIGNLCEAIASPNTIRLVEAFMKLSSASNMAAASIARDQFDARRIKADSVNFSAFVENLFTKVKEAVISGGGSKKEDSSKVEPPQYFNINLHKETGQKAFLISTKDGFWGIGIDGKEMLKGFNNPEDAVNEWNKQNE